MPVAVADEQHHGRVRGLHREAPAAGQRGAGEEPEGAHRAEETAGGEGSGAGQVQTHCQEATGRGVPCESSESPQCTGKGVHTAGRKWASTLSVECTPKLGWID